VTGAEFRQFIGIDWSGNKESWQKGLKVAVATAGKTAPKTVAGPGPKGLWSREEVGKWICDTARRTRVLIGIDFAFGFPAFDKTIALDWAYVEALCASEPNFYGGQFFRLAGAQHSRFVNSPWLPRIDYSAHYLRATDIAAKQIKGATPQSIFNAIGPAQVGPSSISGMRMLRWVKQHHSKILSIWSFDEIDDERSIIVEVFPRFFPLSRRLSPKLSQHENLNLALAAFDSASASKPPASEDEGDAILAAAALRSLSMDRTLFNLPSGYDRQEGWIFGVPFGGVQ
jgi:hypothetical protein